MTIANFAERAARWDGHERRRVHDADYTGPERRGADARAADARLQAVERKLAELPEAMAEAVAQGMRRALTSPDLLADVGKAAREVAVAAAMNETGNWLWRNVAGSASKLALRVLLIWLVLKLAGLDAAAKAWQLIKG